jgi:predicted Holliday junction resolvase-like endonuclease
MTEISDLISGIQKSGLDAECPECGETSALSSWTLFDGLKPFPTDAEQKKQEMEEEYRLLCEKLEKNIKNIGRSKISAIGSGTGKITETIIPAMKKFGYPIEDCRFLAKPIDYIIFDGASKGKVDYITFMDIKTGTSAVLSPHQKKIRDAVKDNNVKSEVI